MYRALGGGFLAKVLQRRAVAAPGWCYPVGFVLSDLSCRAVLVGLHKGIKKGRKGDETPNLTIMTYFSIANTNQTCLSV